MTGRAENRLKLFTIGYESATVDEVIAALADAGVRRVVDIRAAPLSRRAGFSKNVLAAHLAEAGVGYTLLKPLGTPPEGREAARKGNIKRLREIYLHQLETPEAIAAAAELLSLAADEPCCLLCFERNPAECHRSILVEELGSKVEVLDLFA